MMAITDGARTALEGLPQYIRDQMSLPTRKSYLLNELRKRGRETYNNGGLNIEWHPQMRRNKLNKGAGNPTVASFPQINPYIKAVLNWKTFWMGLTYSEIQILATANEQDRFFKKLERDGKELARDFPERFGPHLFANSTGDAEELDGLDTFSQVSGAAGSTGIGAGQPIGLPNATYAGLPCALGSIGQWSGNWPQCGSVPDDCDYEYYHWSPLVCDYNSTLLPVNSEDPGWDQCGIFALNYVHSSCADLYSQTPDVFVMTADLKRRLANYLQKYQQLILEPESKEYDAAHPVHSYNGIKLVSEFGVPPGCCYGVTFDKMELKCMTDNFIRIKSFEEITTGDTLWKVSWFGELWCQSPLYFPSLKGISTLGT
jgi:hypothetical protein